MKETLDLTHEFDAIYIYQDDGKMRDIIPFLVDIGVDALSGLQPPDVGDVILKETKEKYGNKLALVGGLDPCYTFDFGTPAKVQEAVRQALADAKEGGGYILGTGEAVDPQTTPECLKAVSEVVNEFGVY